MYSDLRHAFRLALKTPAFTAGVLLILALAIGVTTTIFSLVNGVLLRPLPFDRAEQLVEVWEIPPGQTEGKHVADANFFDLREQATSFEDLAAHVRWYFNLTGDAGAERVPGALVSANLFAVLRAKAALGRAFDVQSFEGTEPEVVLSHRLWQRRYGGDSEIAGKTITVDGQTRPVAGVMPPDFRFPNPQAELWYRVSWTPEDAANRSQRSLRVIGRLRPSLTLAQARAEMATISARLAQQYPDGNEGWSVGVESLHESVVGDSRAKLLVLLAVVGCVLLVACLNIAGLLTARGEARVQEYALRGALGASRLRLLRGAVTESLLLALAGGALGVLVARWGITLLTGLIPPTDVPRLDEVTLDGRVLAFALAVSLLSGLIAAGSSALLAARRQPAEAIQAGGLSAAPRRRRYRTGALLVVVEVALSLMVVVAAGLLAKSFWRLSTTEPGFDTENLLTMSLSITGPKYREDHAVVQFYDEVLSRIRALPGVVSAGSTVALPLSGGWWTHGLRVEGLPEPEPEDELEVGHKVISHYLETMGIPLLDGRFPTDSDDAEAPRVILINESLARHFFPDQSPVGRRVRRPGEDRPWLTIIGVVGDEKHYGLDADAGPAIYEPHRQRPFPYMSLVVRVAGDANGIVTPVRNLVAEVDPLQPVYGIRTMEEMVARDLAPQRLASLLVSLFAGLALLLAVTGLASATAFSVNRRQQEIGVRRALGAKDGDVLSLIMRRGTWMVLLGVVAGGAASLALSRFLVAMLFEVSTTDAGVFLVAALALVATCTLANYLTARRSTRIDPTKMLRQT